MRIGELAKRTGVSERSLRHYETKGLIFSQRLDNGYRDFDDSQIERVKAVQFYLGLGLNTEQIGKIMTCSEKRSQKNCTKKEAIALYERKLAEINENIENLLKVKSRVEERLALLKNNQIQPLMVGLAKEITPASKQRLSRSTVFR